jgi:hypothetical protein
MVTVFRTSVAITGQMEIHANTREEAEARFQEIIEGIYDGKYLKCVGIDDVKLEVMYDHNI